MSSPYPKKSQSGLKPLKLLFPFLRPYRPAIFAAFISLMVAGLTVLAIVGGLKDVIDQGFVAGSSTTLNQTLIHLLIAILVLATSTYFRYKNVTWLGERVVADLRRAAFRHLLKLSPTYFETARSGDILSRLSSDTSVLQTLIGSSISVTLRNCVLLIGGIVKMFLTDAKLTGLMLLVIPVVVVPIIFFGRKVKTLSRFAQEKNADVNAKTEETIYGIRTVQAFVHEDISATEFNSAVEIAIAAALRFIRVRAWLTALIIFLVFSMIGIVLWIGGHDVLRHTITAGQLSAFVGYAAIAAGASGSISEAYGDFNRAAGATERIFELLEVAPLIAPPNVPHQLPNARGEIQFNRVTFSYPSRLDVPALTDISFSAKAGERVAIVGPSGAGKTTLFQLALRFYDPQSGSLSLDGVDIRTVDPKEVRARIGLVPQDPVIFSSDAYQNIAYGRKDATEADIIEAARAANADTFISALPMGYGTFLGEKGVRLSGGQKQRIAIARALLRNPPLLLLDEATSALDAESEQLVQGALDRLMQGRTTLIIAHRLATVMNADRILVMEQGKIVAQGTHQSLLAEGGLYARLANLQFKMAT